MPIPPPVAAVATVSISRVTISMAVIMMASFIRNRVSNSAGSDNSGHRDDRIYGLHGSAIAIIRGRAAGTHPNQTGTRDEIDDYLSLHAHLDGHETQLFTRIVLIALLFPQSLKKLIAYPYQSSSKRGNSCPADYLSLLAGKVKDSIFFPSMAMHSKVTCGSLAVVSNFIKPKEQVLL